jgi:hypothetical protein
VMNGVVFQRVQNGSHRESRILPFRRAVCSYS